jgi:hypothetical protein
MSKIEQLRQVLRELLAEHERDGAIPTSARFLFYELVQRGVLSKEHDEERARRPDQDLHDALMDIGEDDSIPWDWIVDETRSIEHNVAYPSVKEGVVRQLPYVELDPWEGNKPFILTESRSLAGALRPIAEEYRCRLAATNGQCGGFLRTDVALYLTIEHPVLYFGDLDLAGGQIEENTRCVLEDIKGDTLQWERLAITREQVEQYEVPVIIKKDKRYKNRRFERALTTGRPLRPGEHEAVETEALRQTVLMDILRQRLDALLPEPLARVRERGSSGC